MDIDPDMPDGRRVTAADKVELTEEQQRQMRRTAAIRDMERLMLGAAAFARGQED